MHFDLWEHQRLVRYTCFRSKKVRSLRRMVERKSDLSPTLPTAKYTLLHWSNPLRMKSYTSDSQHYQNGTPHKAIKKDRFFQRSYPQHRLLRIVLKSGICLTGLGTYDERGIANTIPCLSSFPSCILLHFKTYT